MKDEAREKIEQMKEEDLTRLIKILGWYTLKEIRSRKLFFRTGQSTEMPDGYDVDSVVNEAFTRVFTGQRQWDPNQNPDLGKYLRDVIDSILSHLATGKDNVMLREAGSSEDNDDSQWEAGSKERRPEREWLNRGSKQADDELIERERLEEEERVLQMLVEECSTDPILARVLQIKREFDADPAEISERTGIPVKDIYNAIKRLDRKIILVRRRLNGAR